jgi:hypothetical protein
MGMGLVKVPVITPVTEVQSVKDLEVALNTGTQEGTGELYLLHKTR